MGWACGMNGEEEKYIDEIAREGTEGKTA